MIIQPLPSAKTVIPFLPIAKIPQRPPAITTTKQTNKCIFTFAPFFKGAIFLQIQKNPYRQLTGTDFMKNRLYNILNVDVLSCKTDISALLRLIAFCVSQ